MAFRLVHPVPMFKKGEKVTVAFEAQVACTAADCSTYTAGSNNFNFALFLDEDRAKDSETALVVTGSFDGIRGSQGRQVDIRYMTIYYYLSVFCSIPNLKYV